MGTGTGAGERHLYRLGVDTGSAPECLTCDHPGGGGCLYTRAILDPLARGYIQVRARMTEKHMD